MANRIKSSVAVKGKAKQESEGVTAFPEEYRGVNPLTVILPDLDTVPEEYRGKPYNIDPKMFGREDNNPKLEKSNLSGGDYLTWGLSLAPAHESGYQMCSSASPGCVGACLFHQGRGQCPSIAAARIAKTIALMEHRKWFEPALRAELRRVSRKANKLGKRVAIRLNVVSDFPWEQVMPWLFEEFPQVQFYDYTKHYRRMVDWCKGKLVGNYHLTFSRSECNESKAVAVLKAGGNVAVVFRSRDLPAQWNGYTVVNGDETDLRFLDDENVVVGLYAKGTGRHDDSGFVVDGRVALPMFN